MASSTLPTLPEASDALPPPPLVTDKDGQGNEGRNNTNTKVTTTKKLGSLQSRFLTEIVWKRPWHVVGNWERKRIELRGTMLYYYHFNKKNADVSEKEEESEHSAEGGGGGGAGDEVLYEPSNNPSDPVASPLLSSATAAPAPRGQIDLTEERISVYASRAGHSSGAPTPFAIVITTQGDYGEKYKTWKFCFESHKTQMEWLATLTDIVVQSSVNDFNQHLLVNSNRVSNDNDASCSDGPTQQQDAAAAVEKKTIPSWQEMAHEATEKVMKKTAQFAKEFSAAVTGANEEERGVVSSWKLETYTIFSEADSGSCYDSDDDDDNDDDSDLEESYNDYDSIVVERGTTIVPSEKPDSSSSPTMFEESSPRFIKKMAKWQWHIPEHKLLYAAAILNACAVYREVSMIKFLFLLLVSNAAACSLCVTKEPSWESVLQLLEKQQASTQKIAITGRRRNKEKKRRGVKKDPPKDSYVPVAGTTAVRLKQITDVPVVKDQVFTGFRAVSGKKIQVRSHGYALTGHKIASPGELYEVVCHDMTSSPWRCADFASRVKLPECDFHDDNEAAGSKTWKCPDIFIVSIAIPTDKPEFGRSATDGGGYNITMYFKMKRETREILRRVTAAGYDPSTEQLVDDDPQKSKVNAVRLLEEWCRRAPADPETQARFKVIPTIDNVEEMGLPSWISRISGKPFLIKRAGQTGFIYEHPKLSCMEFDISLHPFPYLAKQGICLSNENYFKKALLTWAFVIEGRSDDEVRLFICLFVLGREGSQRYVFGNHQSFWNFLTKQTNDFFLFYVSFMKLYGNLLASGMLARLDADVLPRSGPCDPSS